MKSTKLDNIGKKFNQMTILNFTDRRFVNCQCECGNIKRVDYYGLLRNKILSCGCSRKSERYIQNQRELACAMHKIGKLSKGGRRDSLSAFRIFQSRIKQRHRQAGNLITLYELKEQWEKQGGICPYSGWALELQYLGNKSPSDKPWLLASVDRIDSSKGYVKENIHFISRILNYAKNDMSDSKMKEFMQALHNI